MDSGSQTPIGPNGCDAATWSRSALAASVGVGLKAEHYRTILQERPSLGFFEIHAENYMGDGGPPHRYLEAIRDRYALSLHGVGLNLGGSAPLSMEHLGRLKRLIDQYQPSLFSEHLAWTATSDSFLNDLLPIPYTRAALDQLCERIDITQSFLKAQMLLENPATYVQYVASDIPETDFLDAIAKRTGCGLLLDVNNVYVSAANHGFDPAKYLEGFPVASVREIHLAGHSESTDGSGNSLLIDAHDSPVRQQVWSLYRWVLPRVVPVPTLVEWDNDVPAWPTLLGEARKAEALVQGAFHIAAEDRHAPAIA